MHDEHRLLTTAESAALVGVHRTTLGRWADAGRLPYYRQPDGSRMYRQSDITRLRESRQTEFICPPEWENNQAATAP